MVRDRMMNPSVQPRFANASIVANVQGYRLSRLSANGGKVVAKRQPTYRHVKTMQIANSPSRARLSLGSRCGSTSIAAPITTKVRAKSLMLWSSGEAQGTAQRAHGGGNDAVPMATK